MKPLRFTWWFAGLALWLGRLLGLMLGLVLGLFNPKRVKIAYINLALCFPNHSIIWYGYQIIKIFLLFAISFVDRLWLWFGPVSLIRYWIRLSVGGVDFSKPAIYFMPHFVGIDATWMGLSEKFSHFVTAMYDKNKITWLENLIVQGRTRFQNVHLIPRNDPMMRVLKNLKQGDSLFILPDLDLGERSGALFIPFFGQPAATITALPRLARLTQLPVYFVVSRLTWRGYEVTLQAMPNSFPSDDVEADLRLCNQWLEQAIVTMPAQYHWLHQRFKTAFRHHKIQAFQSY